MRIEAIKTLNLIPIGKIRFSFTKRKDRLWIGEVSILQETNLKISPETEKALIKLMKAEGSELLTDGRKFYTTRGTLITQLEHPSFEALFNENEEIHTKITNLKFVN